MVQTANTLQKNVNTQFDWISRMKENENKTLKIIYTKYRKECIHDIQRKHQISMEDAKEIFQVSIIILYDNIMSGKLDQLKTNVKNYILGVAHKKVLESYRQQKKEQKIRNASLLFYSINEKEEMNDEQMNMVKKLNNALEGIGDPCKYILQLFYYKRFSITDITQLLGYKNDNTTKNLKYKCIKRLQKKIN